jgi:hypothetical protein
VGSAPPEYSCVPGAVLLAPGPAQLELVVQGADGGHYAASVTPAYALSFPNGDECGPPCETAVLTARLE